MKREVLFEAVRDEHGDLQLEITDTHIAIYMDTDFWRTIIQSLAEPAKRDDYFDVEDLSRNRKVLEMIKEGVDQQEEEEKVEEEKEPE